jgi:hypothetical protein
MEVVITILDEEMVWILIKMVATAKNPHLTIRMGMQVS